MNAYLGWELSPVGIKSIQAKKKKFLIVSCYKPEENRAGKGFFDFFFFHIVSILGFLNQG